MTTLALIWLAVDSYLVPAREATAEIDVKRSRFHCRVVRVATENAARAIIAEERRAYGTARHHCSAFVLGPDASMARSNDDGEPSGTAGPPILEALHGAGLSDTVAVVTRWFGGTLLGTGGLVQAYGDATRSALDRAGSRRRELRRRVQAAVDYAAVGRLEDQLRRLASAVEVDYSPGGSQTPVIRVAYSPEDRGEVLAMIMTGTGGTAVITDLEPSWVDSI